MKTIAAVIVLATVMGSARAGPPGIYSEDGQYLGDASANQFDKNSVSNPFGKYGNPQNRDSINNPQGRYGSPLSEDSVNNPFAKSGKRNRNDDWED